MCGTCLEERCMLINMREILELLPFFFLLQFLQDSHNCSYRTRSTVRTIREVLRFRGQNT